MSARGASHEARQPDPHPGNPGKPTGLTAAIEKLAGQIAEGRAWMSPKEAADFLGMREDEFRRIAPELPRHPLPTRGTGERPRYRYYGPELTEWMLERV